jgi:hypothetical protein
VAIGDFNGDGNVDLAVAHYFGGSVSILLGNGTGSFGAATYFPVGGSSVAIGDFNGDGKLDLAMASPAISILLGDGTATFGAATSFGLETSPVSVAIGDFNGDGKPDLVVSGVYYNVYLNTTP